MNTVTSTAALRVVMAALLAATSLAAVAWSGGEAGASEPVVTSDIVLIGEDAFEVGESAQFSMRNDGEVPYRYAEHQPQCGLTYEDASGRRFEIPPAVHCDLPQETDIAPGETIAVIQSWQLDECTEPGFFCYGVRPLESGDYTISGSLLSADGTKRAEFSKTVAITGPTFTNDITATFGVIVSDPPTGEIPVFLTLRNHGNVAYQVWTEECGLRLTKPDGRRVFIPVDRNCGGSPPCCLRAAHSTSSPTGTRTSASRSTRRGARLRNHSRTASTRSRSRGPRRTSGITPSSALRTRLRPRRHPRPRPQIQTRRRHRHRHRAQRRWRSRTPAAP